MTICKVLVVDDSPADLANIRNIFSELGIVVSTASSGRDAVTKAKSERPGMIFLDIVMPDIDGFETCRQLKADPTTKDIPVVFVSSKNQKADKVWAQMQGGRAYVTKPYTVDAIVDQLKALA